VRYRLSMFDTIWVSRPDRETTQQYGMHDEEARDPRAIPGGQDFDNPMGFA
jgi:hypothetical protein